MKEIHNTFLIYTESLVGRTGKLSKTIIIRNLLYVIPMDGYFNNIHLYSYFFQFKKINISANIPKHLKSRYFSRYIFVSKSVYNKKEILILFTSVLATDATRNIRGL